MAALLLPEHDLDRRPPHLRRGDRPAMRLVEPPVAVTRIPARRTERPVAAAAAPVRGDVPWVSIVLGCTVLFLVLGVVTLANGRGALRDAAPARTAAVAVPGAPTVTVQVGDTLWSIATRIQPTGDVRDLVDELVALNGSADLRPGQVVLLPG